jgi:predicted acylesterase/phospholipase RssA/CRP-like cAMP-binding protein
MVTLPELLSLQDRGGFLADLTPAEVGVFAGALREERCDADAVLLAPDRGSEAVYLVLEGSLVAHGGAEAVGTEERGPGDILGAVAAMTGAAQQGEVRATTPCRLAVLDRPAQARLFAEHPEIWRKLDVLALQRMRRAQLTHHLNLMFGPFGPLLPHVMRDLEGRIEWVSLPSGAVLFHRGEEPDAVYVLLAGRLLVTVQRPGADDEIVGAVSPGELVGEAAVLTNRWRSGTVVAARDSELVRLPPDMFELLLERSPRTVFKVSRLLADRLSAPRTQYDPSQTPVSCTAIVPAHPAVGLAEVTAGVVRHMEGHGRVTLLTSAGVDRALDTPGIAQSTPGEPAHFRLIQWLEEEEAQSRYLVYQADAEWTAWTERCVRQSDVVVAVADASARPDLRAVSERLGVTQSRWHLLLLHPSDADRPRNTARWLDGSNPQGVYHVRHRREADLSRLARFLTGRAVGLVLGGGGARGFAHLGVLRALEELGVPVDMIGAASVGAPIAAGTAQGRTAAHTAATVGQRFRSLMDFTLPIVSLLAGRRTTRSIEREMATWDIEDLWLPFFCVSTNLSTASTNVHRRGDLVRAVRASVALPGILPPVPVDGELLVDGGVLDNLPVRPMRQLNPFGPIIAVDVGASRGFVATSDFGLAVSGWRLALQKLLPWTTPPDIPTLGTTVVSAMVVASSRERDAMVKERAADFYLNIDVRGVGLLDFDAVEHVAEIGYAQSIGALRTWMDSGALADVTTTEFAAERP